jgi:hypothetical protein
MLHPILLDLNLLLDPNFDLFIDLGNRNTNPRPPNRRHHPPRLRSASFFCVQFCQFGS